MCHDYNDQELHVADLIREIIQMLGDIGINKDIYMMDQRLTSDAYARDRFADCSKHQPNELHSMIPARVNGD